MKISSKKRFLLPTILTLTLLPTVSLVAASCGKTDKFAAIKTAGYADSMTKLANGSITVAGAWSDARFYAGKEADNLLAIGATEYISNDGIQSRKDLKKGDIEIIQKIFIEVVKKAEAEAKKGTEGNLTYKDDKGKLNSIFKIYNHDGYSAVGYDAEIAYNIAGDKKKAYTNKPQDGNEYFKEEGGKIVAASSKTLKIQFIPSSDASLVTRATQKLLKYFKEDLKLANIDISVSADYNAAAQFLASGSIDVAFLPIDTWAKLSGDSNFILQAGRDVQIIDPYQSLTNSSQPKFGADDEKLLVEAFNFYKKFNKAADNKRALYINQNKSENPQETSEGYPETLKNFIDELTKDNKELPKVGYYRSYIYAHKNSKIAKLVLKALKEQGSNWQLEWKDVKDEIIYGYTSTTSAASFSYPEQWFKKHFKGFESFLK
ncbi:hypothetical protein [Metamycoplasma equirhinis]|uniref:hypothetical protein n=1 Tax=Metamycoplasma equirhinis TaxID=92402 RepID=UPI0035931FCF